MKQNIFTHLSKGENTTIPVKIGKINEIQSIVVAEVGGADAKLTLKTINAEGTTITMFTDLDVPAKGTIDVMSNIKAFYLKSRENLYLECTSNSADGAEIDISIFYQEENY